MSTEVKSQQIAVFDQSEAAGIEASIQRALREDVGSGDATTNSIVSPEARLEALIKTKQRGVVAGLNVAAAVFQKLDRDIEFEALVEDGSWVESGITGASINGAARS